MPESKWPLSHPEVRVGGRWSPSDCLARQKVGIILPYRDRERHLALFLNHIHPILIRQMLSYTIFIVEQVGSSTCYR